MRLEHPSCLDWTGVKTQGNKDVQEMEAMHRLLPEQVTRRDSRWDTADFTIYRPLMKLLDTLNGFTVNGKFQSVSQTCSPLCQEKGEETTEKKLCLRIWRVLSFLNNTISGMIS
uniref:Uncharacterized protein n=1 Tax=Molossus molossus TaxID=27622 RepID=A0A7J8GQW4_MOLMO|nr:hypothetical protein HJG59_011333 [Molossus molossus]